MWLSDVSGHRGRGVRVAHQSTHNARLRLRPILMSTITTVLGLSPLVFMPGAGTELYRGLGAVVMFGILYSAVVTVLFLPAILALVFGLRQQWLGRRMRTRPAGEEPG